MGFEGSEDAGVYKISPEVALIQTVDFFTPIVDDPYDFGRIAAANALSDVYAMGGKPITAMNIVCFPAGKMDMSILKETLRGGLEKVEESGAVLVGGHSVEDDEFKYGLSVTGIVHPEKVVRNSTARVGDALVLTKPIGTGIVNTALKGDMAEEKHVKKALEVMAELNKKASEGMVKVGVSACTDVTGFGLLGHLLEMLKASGVGAEVYVDAVPVLPGVLEYASMGLVPAGTRRNIEFFKGFVEGEVDDVTLDVLFDPQTSGGLLISVPDEKLSLLTGVFSKDGVFFATIGRIIDKNVRVVLKS